ncbi:MAG TPA: FAD-dependent oxidoreductase [Alphaproteobacteria bacterium]
MTGHYDAAIIGAGVYGLMTAEKLAAAGQRVIVIDRFTPGHAVAASSGLTRAMHSLYDDAFYAGLAEQAVAAWRADYADAVVACGAAVFATEPESCVSRILRHGAARYREITTAEMRQRYPQVGADYGCVEAQAGVLRLEWVRARLLERIGALGVSCAFGQEVMAIRDEGAEGFLLELPDRRVSCRNLVICAGGFSQEVVDRIDGYRFDLRLRQDKPGLLHLFPRHAEQAALMAASNMPAFAFIEDGIFVLPVIGGGIDYIKMGSYMPGGTQRGAAEIRAFIEKRLPFLMAFEVRDPAVMDQCTYDMTPDGDFIVGPLPGLERAVIACGWNGGGYKFAPVLTDMIRGYALDGENNFPVRFNPDRFL